jgi:hypothetical protein
MQGSVERSQSDFLSSRLDPPEKMAVMVIKDVFRALAQKFPNGNWNEQKTRRLLLGRRDREGTGLVGTVPGIEVEDIPEYASHDGKPVKRLIIDSDFSTLDLFGLDVKVYTPQEKSISESNYPQLSHIFPRLGQLRNDNITHYTPSTYPNYPPNTVDTEGGEGLTASAPLGLAASAGSNCPPRLWWGKMG